MRPSDLDLPPKFSEWRPGQLDAIIAAITADTRFVILNMPTGTGKTPMYVGVSRILGGRTLILTNTKGLQDQIMADFESLGMRQVKGQANYPCVMLEDEATSRHTPGCDEGPCHAGTECIHKEGGCLYYDAVRAAGKASLVVTNYSYWLHLNRYAEPGTLGKFDTLVLDEAHETVEALSEFIQIRLDKREIRRLLRLDLPRSTHIEEWVEWAEYALGQCRTHLEAAKAGAGLFRKYVGVVRDLKRVEAALEDLLMARDWKRTDVPDPIAWVPGQSNDWLVEQDPKGVTFQPVWPIAYSHRYLFAGIPKVIMVSATVTVRDAHHLGIGKAAITYKSFTSPFDRDNRPVYYIPTAAMSRRSTKGEERIWMNRIDQIIEHEMGQKGIIHTVSYTRARYIYENSRFSAFMMVHDPRDARLTIEAFKGSSVPAILLSPSVSTGYDFPGDEARWQIITKVPFIDTRPIVVQARVKSDHEYLNYKALVALVQMCGRGVRSDTDVCRTYIIDDNWRWFRSAVWPMIPRWFKDSLQMLDGARGLPPVAVLTGKKGRW